MKITDFKEYKRANKKITVLTCYDYSFAKIIADSDIDCILVGDSVAMTMHGHEDTIKADVKMMSAHTRAVASGVLNKKKFLVADLPFMSYRGSLDSLVEAVTELMRAGANAVKLEGVDGNLDYIRHLVASGVPVMGHIGLTPQFINLFGGYKVQGRNETQAELIIKQAQDLEKAGCFSIVLECIPTELAEKITALLTVPTIGIGAGNVTDGQVLVLQDFLGMNMDFKPKFVKAYLNGGALIQNAVNLYCQEVRTEQFPSKEHSFSQYYESNKTEFVE